MRNVLSSSVIGSILILSLFIGIVSSVRSANSEEMSFKADNIELGADIIQADMEMIEPIAAEAPTVTTALPVLNITDKRSCFHKVLNTVDYYNSATGIIETNMLNGEDCIINYSVNMIDTCAYQHVVSGTFDEEVTVENGTIKAINHNDPNGNYTLPAYFKSSDTADYDNDYERVFSKDGIMTYSYRMNQRDLD